MSLLHISLLGEFQLRSQGAAITGLTAPRYQSLLAYLILHSEKVHTRQQLAFQFWADSTEKQARTNLRKALYHFRQVLPDAERFLALDSKEVQWRTDVPCLLDVATFKTAVASAKQTENEGEKQAHLKQAVHCYRGELLPGLYDDWILAERECLRQQYTTVLDQLVELLENQRLYPAAIEYAQRLLRHAPLQESVYRDLIRLQALNGNLAGALRTYHTCATTMQRELSVGPSPATCSAYERLLKTGKPTATALPRRAPLVARAAEWAALLSTWQQARAGQPTVALISGEAGIGKTRLAEELLDWANRQGITTASATCYAAEGQLPYAPVTDWLRSEDLRAVLPTLDKKWRVECARLVPELLTQQSGLPPPEPLTEAWQRQHLFAALAHAVLAAEQPILLLLDDLQWCDPDTLAWLHFILRYETGSRLLLLCTVRAEDLTPAHPLAVWRGHLQRRLPLTEIFLGRLDAEATAALAMHTTGRSLASGQAAELYQETEGHPLFIVEMARARLQAPETGLPDKVKAVIEMHLSQLSPPARELVGMAAVLGRSFTFDLLAAVSGGEDKAWLPALDELWQRGIVRERGVDEYDFSHGKIRQAAYEMLTPARHYWGHKQVLRALQTVYADNLDAVQGQLAAHCEALGKTQQAIKHFQQAAEVSQGLFAHQETVQYLQRARALLPRDAPPSEQAAALNEQLGDVLLKMGEHKSAREAFVRAISRTCDPVRQARILGKKGGALQSLQHFEDANQAYQDAIQVLRTQPGDADQGWWRVWITVQLSLLDLFYFEERLSEMENLLAALETPLADYGSVRQRATYFLLMNMVSHLRSRFCPGEVELALIRQSFDWSRKAGAPGLIAHNQFSLGFNLLWFGEADAAIEEITLALAEAERLGDIPLQDRCLAYLSIGYRFQGNTEQVRALTEQGLAVAEAEKNVYYQGVAHANRAWLCFRAGDMEGVIKNGRVALSMWDNLPYPFHWLARFPLLAVSLSRGEIEESFQLAAALLVPPQQRLPDELTEALEKAINASTPRPHLEHALQVAREMGYL